MVEGHRRAPQPTMTTKASLIEELERALAAGTNPQRIEMLSRITDLFQASAGRHSADQINLFDEVIAKLANAIEAKARAKRGSISRHPDCTGGRDPAFGF
jgi:hypothetical protein